MKREKVIETINELPQEFELEDLMERLVFIDKVNKGLEQLKEGKTLTHDQVKKEVNKWQK
jgi:predicted transcriptional regulator